MKQNYGVYILADQEKKGTLAQAMGLMQAMGYHDPQTHHIHLPYPVKLLPRSSLLTRFLGPWAPHLEKRPSLVVGAGRSAVMLTAYLKQRYSDTVFAVALQNPLLPPSCFDKVVAPYHDKVTGAQVIETLGPLNQLTPSYLAQQAKVTQQSMASFPRPWIVVCVGGLSRWWKKYTPWQDLFSQFLKNLHLLHSAQGGSLWITCSRRTPPLWQKNLQQFTQQLPQQRILWSGQGNNPYHGWLGLADGVIVTGDSLSMMMDALMRPVPLYIAPCEAMYPVRLQRFHQLLQHKKYARILSTPSLDSSWAHPIVWETQVVAPIVHSCWQNFLKKASL